MTVVYVKMERDELIEIVKWVYSGRSYRQIQNLFPANFPGRPVASISSISRTITRFESTGSVENLTKSRLSTVNEPDNQAAILAAIEVNPHTSIRQLSGNSGISYGSVHNILKTMKYHPYKVQNHQALNEDDPDRRMQFCEW